MSAHWNTSKYREPRTSIILPSVASKQSATNACRGVGWGGPPKSWEWRGDGSFTFPKTAKLEDVTPLFRTYLPLHGADRPLVWCDQAQQVDFVTMQAAAAAISNCDRCYRRKSKCDRLVPCGGCRRTSSECVYTDRTREKTVKAGVVDRLERRLEQTEQRNKALVAELSSLRSIADASDRDVQQKPRTASATECVADNTSRRLRTNEVAAQVSYLSMTACLLYTSPSPRDGLLSRMPSSA